MACLAFCACIATPNRDWLVAQAFQTADSGDFPVASLWSTGLESPVNWQRGMSALHMYGSWKATFRFFACIRTMNRAARRVRGPGLHPVGPVPSPGGSWKAPSALRPCIGTMNRGPSRAGQKAPINRTHSKRFAWFGDAQRSRSVWSACVFSASFPKQAPIR